ncbi:MAG: DUF3087 domain-containing protein [Aliiglaciecola sp.]
MLGFMQLIEIDKARYRRHLNCVIAICILGLAVGSLTISQMLIALFPNDSGSHFHWNLLGVIVTCVLIGWQLNRLRTHEFMTEVVYVWDLKQALNKINRKMEKLKAGGWKGDIEALNAIQFSYSGSRQLWQLDDNTITMDELVVHQAELDSIAKQYNVVLRAEDYDNKVLERY